MKAKLTFLLACCFIGSSLYGQKPENFPQVGKPVLDYIINDLQYSNSPSLDLRHHGRPLIIDFFTTGCTACFQSLPKVNKLAAEFKDQASIVMVGKKDSYI